MRYINLRLTYLLTGLAINRSQAPHQASAISTNDLNKSFTRMRLMVAIREAV